MTVMTEPSPVVDEFSQVEQRIQSLTTLLSNLDRRRHKTPNDPYTPPILQSIATLLTCEQKAAVTGTITSTDADILIATDATPLDSDSGIGVGIEPVHFDTVPFRTTLDDSRGRFHARAKLIWTALVHTDFSKPAQVSRLNHYILVLGFPQFIKRFSMHETLFSTVDGDAFYQYFWDWEPSQSDRVATRAVDAITIPSLQPSASLHSAEGEGKWEFSTRTLQTWARLLCQLIGELDEALDEVESSEESPGTSTGWEDSTIKVNEHCMALHTLLREGVLETLLLRTSLGSFLEEKLRNCCSAVSLPQHFIEDVTIDVQWQGNEARANQVLRFLEGLLSWHDAVHNLQKNVGEIMSLPADKVNVAIVKQSAVAHDLLPLSQICDFITGRRSDAQDSELFPSSEDAQGLLRSLCDYDEGKKFAGSVHPEATLLGLVTHWNTPHPVNYDAEINDVEELAMMLQKRDRFIAVGSSNQCCFCCHIVGRHKEEDVIDAYPGTNGVIHPWTPPRVGVKLSILKDVEAFLWDQLESIIKAHWDPPLSSIMRYRCESHSPTSQRDPTASLLLGFHDLPPSPPSSTYYRSTISPDVARRLQENRSQDRIIREMFHSPTSPSLRDLDYISECDSSPSTNESELIPDMEWRSLLRRGSRSSGKRVVRLPSLPSPRQRPHKALEPDDSDAGSDGGCPCSHPFSSDFLQPSLSRRSSAGSFHSNHDARRSHRRLSQSSAAGRQHPYR